MWFQSTPINKQRKLKILTIALLLSESSGTYPALSVSALAYLKEVEQERLNPL